MESYDIFLLVVLVGAVLFGALKGMAWQVASLSAIFVSYFVALNFHESVAGFIDAEEPWDKYIAMFSLYMGTSLCIWIVFAVVRRFIEQVHLKDFDRHAGALLGAVNGAIVCVLITFFAVTLPILGDEQKTAICRSKSGYLIAEAIGKMEVGLPQDVNRVVTPYLDGLREKLDEHQPPRNELDAVTGQPMPGAGERSEGPPTNWREVNGDRTARQLLNEIDQHFRSDQR